MAPEGKPFVIALEEHYYDPELAATFDGPEGRAHTKSSATPLFDGCETLQ